MAAVVKRTWCSRGPTGHKVRKVAWGYTLQVNGQQERRYGAAWSRRDAEEALARRLLELLADIRKRGNLNRPAERHGQADALEGRRVASATRRR